MWGVVVALLVSAPSAWAQVLEIRFLDVGQGDAVLVRSGGKAILIDAGPGDQIVGRLRELRVDSLDLLIASHNHIDHIGGAFAVLTAIPVRYYLDNGRPATTQVQARVLGLVEQKGIVYLQATARSIAVGETRLRILPSPLAGLSNNQNNQSVAVIVENGPFKALLSGDSEVGELDALISAAVVADVDVLKAAHHGSRNGLTADWLSVTKPEVIVISVGANNSYGHPDPIAIQLYEAGGRQVYRTDQSGDVVVRVEADGKYRVCVEKPRSVESPNPPATCQ